MAKKHGIDYRTLCMKNTKLAITDDQFIQIIL